MVERWNVGDWGKACGPRPAPREQPGGQLTVRDEAGELTLTGVGRTFRTTECWEQLPGVNRSTHAAADHSWKTQCTSAPNDPRQTTLVTTITATDTSMLLDETGEYQFRIDGQNCTASARRSRSFARAGQAPPTSAAPPGVQPEPTAIGAPATRAAPVALPSGRCASPGDPTRLEVRPSRKWLAPGQKFAFRAIALDSEGCAVDARIAWTVATPNAKITLAPGGAVTVAPDAEDGTVELAVSLAGRSVRVFIEVATPARYEALLSTGSINDAGESEEPAATVVANTNLGANPAVAQDGARSRKTTFVVIIAALALALAGLGFVLLRRGIIGGTVVGDDAMAPDEPGSPDQAVAGGPPQGMVVSQGRPALGRPVVCPSCRTEYPPGSTFCPHDGNRLVGTSQSPPAGPSGSSGGVCPTCGRGYDPGIKSCPTHGDDLVPAAVYRATAQRAAVATERGKICPSCGGRYGGQAVFCGKDGTALVLVN